MYGKTGKENPTYGRKRQPLSEECKRKISIANRGSKNGQWKGDEVSYKSLHDWVKTYLLKPSFCQICDTKPSYDLANISGKYLRDLNDWQYLCRRCHMLSDGRMFNFIQLSKTRQK